VGDRVQRGQVLGLVGNSGNSTEPHLHFHLSDALAPGTSTLGAEGIPYTHERIELLGRCTLAAAGITCTRSPSLTLANVMPAQNQIVRFPAVAAAAAAAPPPDYSAPAGAPYTAESVTVPTPMGHTLAGTLTLPRGASRARPVGVLVTITGSGAQDRDEGMPSIGYQPFRQFADSLSRRGFAVLRMDDRGTGQSKGTWRGSTSSDFAEDIRAGLAYLRTRPEIDARRLGLIGHSEGALIANIVADREPTLRGVVLLAGVARPAHEVLVFQMKNLINHNAVLTQVQKDSAIAAIPARIDTMMARDPWMDFFLKHDPAATSRRVKAPAVLILTGANDQQADPKQVADWEAAFKAAGNRDVTAQVLPGLNHLFAADADGFPGNYTKLPRPVRVESSVIGLVVNWVSARFRP
jgi:dipeptidyl aminopeptidase/acylaminoacyl peptidase